MQKKSIKLHEVVFGPSAAAWICLL